MKALTAEEILENITGHTDSKVLNIPKEWIIQAMEQYASQFYTESDLIDLRQRCAENAEITHKYLKHHSVPPEYEVDTEKILSTSLTKE